MCQTCHVERDFRDWAPLSDIARAQAQAQAEEEKAAIANARFPRFSELPTELRLEIWRMAEDNLDPRVFTIYGQPAHTRWHQTKLRWHAIRVSSGPTLLHVNRESRYELLDRYITPFSPERCFPFTGENMSVLDIHFQPNKDMPFLFYTAKDPPHDNYCEHPLVFLKAVFGDSFQEVTAQIRNIAVENEVSIRGMYNDFISGDPYLAKLEHIFVLDYGEMYHLMKRGCRIAGFPMPPYHFDTRRIMNKHEARHLPWGKQDLEENPYFAMKPPHFELFDTSNQEFFPFQLRDGGSFSRNYGVHSELILARKGRILSRDEAREELSVYFNERLARYRRITKEKQLKIANKQATEAKKAKKTIRKAAREAKRKDFLDFLVPSWFDEE
ncbi:hypothetical protein HYFRA_00002711 [Hymenoscyphus fraxineus]|uniref:2EXR domain-containing protein n=1 Tax=Hymenoscyphus fraxineus TaxID=746836 RepID=A0A9N9LAX7_9HELO|nr:hypothetical protein HYFRA_00002711 [Hymenoscyphus fraxineus]